MQSAKLQSIVTEWRKLARQCSPGFVIPDPFLKLEGVKACGGTKLLVGQGFWWDKAFNHVPRSY